MESILKKVNELEKKLIKAVDEAEKSAEENKAIVAENKEAKSALNAKGKNIAYREESIKPIEDIVEFKAVADQLMKDAKKKMKLALLEQDKADEKTSENARKYAEQKVRIAKEDERILDDKASLKKGYAQLAKAESESETKVLKSIVKKTIK